MPGPPTHFASLLRARRGYLGTNGPQGAAHVLPVCFTWAGEAIWIAVDPRPESGGALSQRGSSEGLQVTFMVDRWDEDWSKVSWLVARGYVTTLEDGDPEAERATAALESKYPQYLQSPHQGDIVRLDVDEWTGWEPEGTEFL